MTDLLPPMMEVTGLTRADCLHLLEEAGNRAGGELGFKYNPLESSTKGIRAIDFAGLLRVSPSIELEVSPKFLGSDSSYVRWREDFFFLATLSRYGRLLETDQLSGDRGATRDLATLVARALTSMYGTRKRRPIRAYRKLRESDFFLDDCADPLDIVFPGPDGFDQEVIRFNQRNQWNAALSQAARALMPEVGDAVAFGSLSRMSADLAPQASRTLARLRPPPSRHLAWSPVLDLAQDILNGLGLSYGLGVYHAPGYVMNTWRAWEDLLTIGARLGFPDATVASQIGFRLGTRRREGVGPRPRAIKVRPDLVVSVTDVPRFIVDAKYKGQVRKGRLRASEADLYESAAFAKAVQCDEIVLAYPRTGTSSVRPVGSCSVFERVRIGTTRINCARVEVRGISAPGALTSFARNLANGLLQAVLAPDDLHV